jgi:hypothetical protein
VAVVAQVLGHLGFERGLEHGLGQPGQQPARADELDPVCAGGLNELLSKLLLIDSVRDRLDHAGQDCSSRRAKLGVSDQFHRRSDSPERNTMPTDVPFMRCHTPIRFSQLSGGV